MSFYIAFTKEPPNLDVLPVALIKNFANKENKYMPYTQCKVVATDTELICQLISFEVNPSEKSCIRALFSDNFTLSISIFADKSAEIFSDDLSISDKSTINFYSGEDLQGIFWGSTIHIPLNLIKINFKPQNTIKGNFIKECDDLTKSHLGTFFNAIDNEDISTIVLEDLKITEF